VVWKWRKAFGVSKTNNPGSQRLVRAAAQMGACAVRGKVWTDEERAQRSRISLDLNLGQYLQPGYHGPHWTAEQLALLGTMPDEEVAARIGRTVEAVRIMRGRRKRRSGWVKGIFLDRGSRTCRVEHN
jgi:hypothetical protein